MAILAIIACLVLVCIIMVRRNLDSEMAPRKPGDGPRRGARRHAVTGGVVVDYPSDPMLTVRSSSESDIPGHVSHSGGHHHDGGGHWGDHSHGGFDGGFDGGGGDGGHG